MRRRWRSPRWREEGSKIPQPWPGRRSRCLVPLRLEESQPCWSRRPCESGKDGSGQFKERESSRLCDRYETRYLGILRKRSLAGLGTARGEPPGTVESLGGADESGSIRRGCSGTDGTTSSEALERLSRFSTSAALVLSPEGRLLLVPAGRSLSSSSSFSKIALEESPPRTVEAAREEDSPVLRVIQGGERALCDEELSC